MPAFVDRFKSLIRVGGPDECWTWSGQVDCRGFGRIRDKRRTFGKDCYSAHKLAYQLANPNVPVRKNERIDQTCGNRLCCNPAHLVLRRTESAPGSPKKAVPPTKEPLSERDKRLGRHMRWFGIQWDDIAYLLGVSTETAQKAILGGILK